MPIVPVPSIVELDFCTMFIVIVVVWFSIAPVLKVVLGHSCWIYLLLVHDWGLQWEKIVLITMKCNIQQTHQSRQNLGWYPGSWSQSMLHQRHETFKTAENTDTDFIYSWLISYKIWNVQDRKLTYGALLRSCELWMLIRSPPMALQKSCASCQVFLRSFCFL